MDTRKVRPMTKPIIFDGNEHREMTEAEYAQYQLDQAEAEARAEARAAKAAAKQAVIDKLGLSAAEVAALLG
jgi:hypothetical protein